jgi:hypothetical protein
MKNINLNISDIIGIVTFAFIVVLIISLAYAIITGQVDTNNLQNLKL